jgi:hypothetical protein
MKRYLIDYEYTVTEEELRGYYEAYRTEEAANCDRPENIATYEEWKAEAIASGDLSIVA